MKLVAYQINGQTIGIDIGVWNDAMLSGNTAFQAIADTGSTPTDYVDISSTVYWGDFGGQTTLSAAEIKTEIVKLIPDVPTAEEYEILEGYTDVGLNSMTNILSGVTVGSVLGDGSYLTGVTDNKLTVVDDQIHDQLIFVDKITGTSATFLENLSVDGQFNMGYANQINTTQELINLRYNAIAPIFSLSGLALRNYDGSGNNFLIGVDDSGVMVIGQSGTTLQPVATGSTTGGTGGTITTLNTIDGGATTTTSATDVLMTGMQLTSVPAGDYFLSFGTSFNHSANGSSIVTTIYVDGSPVANSAQAWTRGNAQGNVYGTHNYAGFPITVASTANVEIYWQTDNSTATSTNRYMSLIKV